MSSEVAACSWREAGTKESIGVHVVIVFGEGREEISSVDRMARAAGTASSSVFLTPVLHHSNPNRLITGPSSLLVLAEELSLLQHQAAGKRDACREEGREKGVEERNRSLGIRCSRETFFPIALSC